MARCSTCRMRCGCLALRRKSRCCTRRLRCGGLRRWLAGWLAYLAAGSRHAHSPSSLSVSHPSHPAVLHVSARSPSRSSSLWGSQVWQKQQLWSGATSCCWAASLLGGRARWVCGASTALRNGLLLVLHIACLPPYLPTAGVPCINHGCMQGHAAAIDIFETIRPDLPPGTELHLVGTLMPSHADYLQELRQVGQVVGWLWCVVMMLVFLGGGGQRQRWRWWWSGGHIDAGPCRVSAGVVPGRMGGRVVVVGGDDGGGWLSDGLC